MINSYKLTGRIGIVIIAAALLLNILNALLSSSASAFIDTRAGIDALFWGSRFTQEGLGRSVNINSNPSLGLGAQVGIDVGPIFGELEFQALLSQHMVRLGMGTENSKDTRSEAIGWQLGVDFSPFPLEIYSRFGGLQYAFSSGSRDEFYGDAIKLGIALPFERWRFKAEAWKQNTVSDKGGSLPQGVKVNVTSFALGVGLTAH